MQKNRLLISILFNCVVAYFLTLIIHNYAHSIAAYCYGLNTAPWLIDNNTPLWLQNVYENHEYMDLDQQAFFFAIGIIGFISYATNWILLLFCLFKLVKLQTRWLNFFYWMVIWNLTAVFSYIPHHIIRSGNVDLIFSQLGISVWIIYVIGVIFSIFLILLLFYYLIPQVFDRLEINDLFLRRLYFTICLFIVLFYSSLRFVFVGDEPLTSYIYGNNIAHIVFWIKLAMFIGICYTQPDLRKRKFYR
ncbi:MAG: hypothetical protein KBD37_05335 [Burkholderiales bacterium]|nr:hypothetical protein [Burkholderiales bacterium]